VNPVFPTIFASVQFTLFRSHLLRSLWQTATLRHFKTSWLFGHFLKTDEDHYDCKDCDGQWE
jgi:hypothetical protein